MLLRFHGNRGHRPLSPVGGQRSVRSSDSTPGGLGRASSLSAAPTPGGECWPKRSPASFPSPTPSLCSALTFPWPPRPSGRVRCRAAARRRRAQSRAMGGLLFPGQSLGATSSCSCPWFAAWEGSIIRGQGRLCLKSGGSCPQRRVPCVDCEPSHRACHLLCPAPAPRLQACNFHL